MIYAQATDLPDVFLEPGDVAVRLERTVDLIARLHAHGAVGLAERAPRWVEGLRDA